MSTLDLQMAGPTCTWICKLNSNWKKETYHLKPRKFEIFSQWVVFVLSNGLSRLKCWKSDPKSSESMQKVFRSLGTRAPNNYIVPVPQACNTGRPTKSQKLWLHLWPIVGEFLPRFTNDSTIQSGHLSTLLLVEVQLGELILRPQWKTEKLNKIQQTERRSCKTLADKSLRNPNQKNSFRKEKSCLRGFFRKPRSAVSHLWFISQEYPTFREKW